MRVIYTRHQKTAKTILPWTPPEGFDRLKTLGWRQGVGADGGT